MINHIRRSPRKNLSKGSLDSTTGEYAAGWKPSTHYGLPPVSNDRPNNFPGNEKVVARYIPVSKIVHDINRFQNRTIPYNSTTVNKIVEGYDVNKMAPIDVWLDPKDQKIYVLSGHSRLEGFKRLGKTTIPVKFFVGSEDSAITFSKAYANKGKNPSNFKHILAEYKSYRDGSVGIQKLSPSQLFMKFPDRRWEFYSFLSQNGNFINILASHAKSIYVGVDVKAKWVGELRKTYPQITDQQENQLFDFFFGNKDGLVISKANFFDRVKKVVSHPSFSDSTNLTYLGIAHIDKSNEKLEAVVQNHVKNNIIIGFNGDFLHEKVKKSVKADNKSKVIFENGYTKDIMSQIFKTFQDSYKQTKDIAESFIGKDNLETCENIWSYVRNNIRYVLDPVGIQYIKTPARTISDGFADCKGYAILIASLLENLGIKNEFRFVSYGIFPDPTHIYNVAKGADNGNDIIIDACWMVFNKEKDYTFKVDKMTKIYSLSGIGSIGLNTTPYSIDPATTSEGEMDLLIARERMELEQQIAQRVSGIGTTLDRTYDYNLAILNEALKHINSDPTHLAGIGDALGKIKLGKLIKKAINPLTPFKEAAKLQKKLVQKKASNMAAKNAAPTSPTAPAPAPTGKKKKKKTKAGKFLQKAGKIVKKAALAPLTAPLQLAAKGFLEVTLPKTAPAYLYLFMTPEQLAKSPDKVKRKHKKASKNAKFITKVVGMKEKHFMGIVRNGITKKYGKTPEQVISAQMNGKVSGIGVVPVLMAIIPLITSIIKKFGKKPAADEDLTSDDLPDPNDFASTSNFTAASSAGMRLLAPDQSTSIVKAPAVKGKKKRKTKVGKFLQSATNFVTNKVAPAASSFMATDEEEPQVNLPTVRGEGMSQSNMMMLGAAGLAAFFFLSKK